MVKDMKSALARKTGKKGFTLMEMLIVVAIIAILVAIAIPIFNAQLEKSRDATDQANARNAKSEIVAASLTGTLSDGKTAYVAGTTYYFDAANGTLVTDPPTAGYGQGTDANYATPPEISGTATPAGGYLSVIMNKETGAVTLTWVAKKA